jgi:hypothetical protein
MFGRQRLLSTAAFGRQRLLNTKKSSRAKITDALDRQAMGRCKDHRLKALRFVHGLRWAKAT